MSDDLVFMMGKFEARFPQDRWYARNHMWGQRTAAGRVRFGFTAYAVRLLQDVYFLEWTVDEGSRIREKQTIGAIESKKAESDLFAPMPGILVTFNAELLQDPSAINVDKYGAGWLFEMQPDATLDESDRPAIPQLLTPSQYVEHLEAVWEVTQRTIKGQLNE